MPDDGLEEYLAMVRGFPPLDPDAERELAVRVRAGDQEALDLLVRSNLRHVLPIADEYRDRGVSRSGLIDEGNLGLIRAAFAYDERAAPPFGEFAASWIRAAMEQGIAEAAAVPRIALRRRVAPPAGDDAPAG